jgi:hypothetical protein
MFFSNYSFVFHRRITIPIKTDLGLAVVWDLYWLLTFSWVEFVACMLLAVALNCSALYSRNVVCTILAINSHYFL